MGIGSTYSGDALKLTEEDILQFITMYRQDSTGRRLTKRDIQHGLERIAQYAVTLANQLEREIQNGG